MISRGIGVTNEPEGPDLMPYSNRGAGYLSVDQDLNGFLTPGDQADGFKIVTKPGKSYRMSAVSVNPRNWAGNNMSTYDSMYFVVHRFDGTTYTPVDTTLHITEEMRGIATTRALLTSTSPPKFHRPGVTYTYFGSAKAYGLVDQSIRWRVHGHAYRRRQATNYRRWCRSS